MSLIILCHPADTYIGKPETTVSTAYEWMAIHEYDAMIDFTNDYDPHKEIPDHKEVVGQKEGRDLECVVFHNQSMIRVATVHNPISSSSYLFSPGEMLPDLDVITVFSEVNKTAEWLAALEIKRFYEKNGWQAKMLKEELPPSKEVLTITERNTGEITIIQPNALREIAAQEMGYDMERLYF